MERRATWKVNVPGQLYLWLPILAGLAVTIAAMCALRPIAYVVDLVDRPGGHKLHHGDVPVVGGIAMLVGTLFGVATLPDSPTPLPGYITSSILIVLVGMLDDRFTVSALSRLVAQFVAVLPMFYGAKVGMLSLGDPLGVGPLTVAPGLPSLLLTAFITMAAVNAFNMMDGLDGLAGGVSLSALGFLLIAAQPAPGSFELAMVAALAGAVTGFLVFNAPLQINSHLRSFMGDAGSTLLGFSLIWLAFSFTQGPSAKISPVTMLWILGIPATDLISTVVRRISRGRSPFSPDNEHLHHLLLKAGLGVRAVFVVLVGLAAAMGYIGLLLETHDVPDVYSAIAFCACGVIVVRFCRRAHWLARVLPPSLRRVN
jgi:UDP-GlcNAc:undecaprenyl-phosphate/decaprenyl-phosphate GlcNAc-1-phosphate transferase